MSKLYLLGADKKTYIVNEPQKGVDYFTQADQEEIVQQVIAALGTPVFGRVDANNNITLTAALADGTYNLWLEDKDGKVSHICIYNHAYTSAPTYTNLFVANTCTLNKRGNSSGETTNCDGIFITDYIDIGNVMSSGGVNQLHYKGMYFDVSGLTNAQGEVYSYLNYYDVNKTHLGHVSMRTVGDTLTDTGDYVITLDENKTTARYIRISAAVPPKPTDTLSALTSKDQLASIIITLNETINSKDNSNSYINQIPISIDSSGNVYGEDYNGDGVNDGYKVGVRVSSGVDQPAEGVFTTGYIPVNEGDVVYLKNITMPKNGTTYNCRVSLFDSLTSTDQRNIQATTAIDWVWDENENAVQFTVPLGWFSGTKAKYMRLGASYIGTDSIVTINQPIEKDSITNMILLSTNVDGTPYNNGRGWKTGYRLNSSAVEAEQEGFECTGFMPIKHGDIIRFKNIKWNINSDNADKSYFSAYNANKEKFSSNNATTFKNTPAYQDCCKYDEDGNLIEFDTAGHTDMNTWIDADVSYFRISAEEITDQSIITINQPIPETESIINQVPLSINTDGTQYVGANGEDGYKIGYRLNSSGEEASAAAFGVTGFIPVKTKDVIYFKNVNFTPGVEDGGGNYIAVYDTAFAKIESVKSTHVTADHYLYRPVETYSDSGLIKSITLADGSRDYAYLRVSATGLNADSIITVNQPIPETESIINQIPLSTDTDGSIYNGVGWIENKRLNSSGVVADTNDYGYTGVTGFIPIAEGDTIRTSANLADSNGSPQQSICFYDSNKTFIARHQYRNDTNKFNYNLFIVNDDKSITFTHDNDYLELAKTAAYVRFCFTGITDGAIITINQPISKTINIPLNFELGIKLSKTDNTYETVSTDHMTASNTYAASQYIDLDTNSEYKVGLTYSNYMGLSLCFFDTNNNFVAYQSDVISGPLNETATAMEHTIVIPDGATKVRLRLYVPINQYNSADVALSRGAAWMTKTE